MHFLVVLVYHTADVPVGWGFLSDTSFPERWMRCWGSWRSSVGPNTSERWASAGEGSPHITWPCSTQRSELECRSMVRPCYAVVNSVYGREGSMLRWWSYVMLCRDRQREGGHLWAEVSHSVHFWRQRSLDPTGSGEYTLSFYTHSILYPA